MSPDPIPLLLVEDDADQAMLVQRVLSRQDPPFAVTLVGDGLACLEALSARPAIVLLDYSLPRMTGIEVLTQMRERSASIPVIMITGQGDERVAVEAMKAGAMDYVVKTTGYLATLPTVIHKVLRQHQLAEENARLHREARRRLRETEGLLNVAHVVTSSLDPEEIARRTAREVAHLFGADAGVFFKVDGETDSCRAVAAHGLPASAPEAHTWPALQPLTPLTRAEPRLLEPVSGVRAPDSPLVRALVLAAPVRSAGFLYVPVASQGRFLGAVVIYWWEEPRDLGEDGLRLARGVGSQVALALDNARLYDHTQRALSDLEAAQERLVRGATLSALGEMASGAAHHLNNLLTVVLGRVELLMVDAAADPVRSSLRIVERAARDAAEVVRRVQRFARAEGVEKHQVVSLNEVAAEVLEMTRSLWKDSAEARGIAIEVMLKAGTVPAVNGNSASLREVVTNLVLNAIDALPRGGHITVRTFLDGPWVCLSVTDDGVGMSERTRLRAFEPFFTTKGPRRTGLGLSVNYGIVKSHDGDLHIDTAEQKGTTVTVRLPVGASQMAAGVATPGTAAPGPAPERAGFKILVVDDDDEVREVVSIIFTKQGQTVFKASGGAEALAILDGGQSVDLVLTDLGMPDMTGWELARAVKQRRPAVPVVLMTGWGEQLDDASADLRHVTRVLSKPVRAATLRDLIAALRPSGPTMAPKA